MASEAPALTELECETLTRMDLAALIIAFFALLAAAGAALYARATTHETRRQADAAAEQIHLACTPRSR